MEKVCAPISGTHSIIAVRQLQSHTVNGSRFGELTTDITNEQRIAVADETKSVFEFTFTKLRAETKERQDFVSKVKKWAGGKGSPKDRPEATG